MTREKHVFDTDMVAHVWAQQTQQSGRNKSNGNFYFEGDTIYSYGSHFPIAKQITRNGKKCVLFTTRTYSNTTAGHIQCVRRALSDQNGPVFNIPSVRSSMFGDHTLSEHKDNLTYYANHHAELARKTVRARSNANWLPRSLETSVAEANEYSKFFGLRKKFKMPELDRKAIAEADAKAKKAKERKDKVLRKEREAREAKAQIEAMENREKWKNGEDIHLSQWDYIGNRSADVLLRVKDDVLETSLGAEVPLHHAVKILPLIRSGSPYLRNGHTIHLGHFALDQIDEAGNVKAGCHTIKREEIERIAALLKL